MHIIDADNPGTDEENNKKEDLKGYTYEESIQQYVKKTKGAEGAEGEEDAEDAEDRRYNVLMGKLQESRNYEEDTLLKESNDLIYDLNAKLDSVDVDKEPTIHEQIRNIKIEIEKLSGNSQ